ncbi:hypothetical protein HHK36_011288 [Tetracentron sinense]|uniref:Homeobox-leucine zipper protein n=1 Tax=Tetracentron sinense TaxID=13715 RepID=A0A834ZA01_TETSI|nr:hypothetical protein HHK36_011288 [Tetracentron sinense]
MAWNSNFRPFVSRAGEHTFTFLYDYNYDQYPGGEVKCRPAAEVSQPVAPASDKNNNNSNQERKRRLTSDQIESLERSFQDEIKLEPERKMMLARELGLQPRQVAVWFQNRRARWKAKQLERVYDSLKQEFDVISREKQKLQEEVMKLKAKLGEEQGAAKQVSTAYTEVSAEETVESTSVVIRSSNKIEGTSYNQIGECNYLFNLDEYNPATSPYWGVLPSYP